MVVRWRGDGCFVSGGGGRKPITGQSLAGQMEGREHWAVHLVSHSTKSEAGRWSLTFPGRDSNEGVFSQPVHSVQS